MEQRTDVTFLSGQVNCAAWLYEPDTAPDTPPRATLVMAHGLGAVRDMGLDAFAQRFVAHGYRCLVFDYRYFGASDGHPRQLLSVRRQREDWAAAVAFARTLPGEAPVVAWGTSFSGGHAIHVGATAGRGPAGTVDAVIAQCPFTDGVASVLRIPPVVSAKLTLRAVRDIAASLLGRDPVTVATAGGAGDTALMTADDVIDGYLGLVPPDSTFRNEVAARIVPGILTSRPGGYARKLTVPALFCLCRADSVAPVAASRRHVARAPQGVVKEYDAGHFDIYSGADFDAVVADQLAFLGDVFGDVSGDVSGD